MQDSKPSHTIPSLMTSDAETVYADTASYIMRCALDRSGYNIIFCNSKISEPIQRRLRDHLYATQDFIHISPKMQNKNIYRIDHAGEIRFHSISGGNTVKGMSLSCCIAIVTSEQELDEMNSKIESILPGFMSANNSLMFKVFLR